jgi:hypothetical protein
MPAPDDDQPTLVRMRLLEARPEPPRPAARAMVLASWSLWLAMVAWLLAITDILAVALTTVSLTSAPLRALEWGTDSFAALTIILAGLATAAGTRGTRRAVTGISRPGWLLRAGASLVIAVGALIATFIAGA